MIGALLQIRRDVSVWVFCVGGEAHISYAYLHFCHGLHVSLKITKAVAGSLHNFNIMCYLAT